jgi:hypothetical protein
MPYPSWEAWIDQVFQVMLNDYPQLFGATDTQSQIHRGEIDWEQWRPWYDRGLSAKEAVDKSLETDE